MIFLNLLPNERKEIVKYTIYYYYGIRIGVLLILLSLIVIVGFKVLEIKLERNFRDVNEAEKNVSLQNFDLAQRVMAFNLNVSKMETVQKDFSRWSDFLYGITSAFPQTGIVVNNLTINRDVGTFSIVGLADSREDFLLFKESLEKNPLLKNVESPFKNILEVEAINFSVSGTLADSAGKK